MPHCIMTIPRPNPAGRFDPSGLFRPTSIAVIGADTQMGGQILANLMLSGFNGGIRAHREAEQLEPGATLAVLAVAAEQIGPSMALLAEKGCFAAIVPGEAESLGRHATRTGVRVLGPHSFGLVVPRLGLNASRAHIPPPAGRLALVSQSAALTRVVVDWAEPNGVGFSTIVGLGRNADIGFGQVLDWLSRDPGTGAILLDIRNIKNHRVFLSAARSASRLRPVVAIHAGLRSVDDAADLAFEAALRRAGVLSVLRLEDLLAAAETLSRARPIRRDTLAIVGNAIGPARLAADGVLRSGLDLLDDSEMDHGILHVPSPDLAGVACRLAARGDVGGVLVVHAPTGRDDEATIASLLPPKPGSSSPGASGLGSVPAPRAALLVCAMGETTGAAHRVRLAGAGLPVFATPGQAVQGFEHLVSDRRNRAVALELPPSTVVSLACDGVRVRRCLGRARAAGRLMLFQDEALEVLAAYGIPVVPTRVAAGPREAAAAMALLGTPAVVKRRESAAPANRLAGGLMLDLSDADAVTAAARQLLARASSGGGNQAGEPPGIEPAGVERSEIAPQEEIGQSDTEPPATGALALLVQRQVSRARELAVRVADDPTFGPMIAFGAGGTGATRSDRAFDLPPLNLALARGLIGRSRAGSLLAQSLRDAAAADVGAVAETLVRISQLIVDFPEIAELEVPSLFADPAGVLVTDAWLRLRGAEEPPGRLAIAPYPAELIEHCSVGGESVTIRPIRPEDAQAHGAFFARLSPEDIRYRFFSAMRQLSAEQMARLTQVDYDREMAFIAVRATSGDTVGVARLVREWGGQRGDQSGDQSGDHCGGPSGEFAVIVQADMKGRGLATHLMRRLIDWARSSGMGEVVGQVLADNHPMLAFVRRLGFSVQHMAEEPDVMEVRLAL